MLWILRLENCDMYMYYGLKSFLIVIVIGDFGYVYLFKGFVDFFIDLWYNLDELYLLSMVLLGRN